MLLRSTFTENISIHSLFNNVPSSGFTLFLLLSFIIINTCFVNIIVAPPVDTKKSDKPTTTLSPEQAQEQQAYGLEYEKYLREVVNVLESDPEFRRKIENASQDDIKSGKIADELDFTDKNIRTKLDEIKRTELERVRDAIEKQIELENMSVQDIGLPKHLNHLEHQFDKEDLRKLIVEATKDLEEIDEKRKDEYKRYEMEKNFEEEQKQKVLDGQELEKAKKEELERKKRHADHEQLNHPMSKDQLEEVWEKEDEMPKEAFDATTFFKLHDLDGNQFLDQGELKALFLNELNKVYNESNPDDDMRQREEEMERMREHVMKELDKDHDSMISFDEFMSNSQSNPDYEKDPGWDTLEKQTVPYSPEEYAQFKEKMVENDHHQQGAPVTDKMKQRVLEAEKLGAPSSRPDLDNSIKEKNM